MSLDKILDESEEKLKASLLEVERMKIRKKQRIHRTFNTGFILIVLTIVVVAIWKVPTALQQREYNSEISQLINDEGLRYKVYKDSLGYRTIGFGHLMRPEDTFTTITPAEAIALLRVDYGIAQRVVKVHYPWAEGDVQLVLTNMSYQLGQSRLAKFKGALKALRASEYQKAAAELLDSRWASQAPKRAQRLAGRVLELDNSWW